MYLFKAVLYVLAFLFSMRWVYKNTADMPGNARTIVTIIIWGLSISFACFLLMQLILAAGEPSL